MEDTTWEGELAEALNDLDMVGGELSYCVQDLYARQEITGRQRRRLITLARRAVKLMDELDELGELRQDMGLLKRPE